LAIASSYWRLGVMVGLATVIIMFVADSFPDPVREEKQEPELSNTRIEQKPTDKTQW
jgi:hypothetical protein